MTLLPYRLPNGRVVLVDATATKGVGLIDFTLADGRIVFAVRERSAACKVPRPPGLNSDAIEGTVCDYCQRPLEVPK